MITVGPGKFMDPRYWPTLWTRRLHAIHIMRDVMRRKDYFFVCDRKGNVVEASSVEEIDAWVKVVDRLESEEDAKMYDGILR